MGLRRHCQEKEPTPYFQGATPVAGSQDARLDIQDLDS